MEDKNKTNLSRKNNKIIKIKLHNDNEIITSYPNKLVNGDNIRSEKHLVHSSNLTPLKITEDEL